MTPNDMYDLYSQVLKFYFQVEALCQQQASNPVMPLQRKLSLSPHVRTVPVGSVVPPEMLRLKEGEIIIYPNCPLNIAKVGIVTSLTADMAMMVTRLTGRTVKYPEPYTSDKNWKMYIESCLQQCMGELEKI